MPKRVKREKLLALLEKSGVNPYATLENEDKKEPTALITSALMAKNGDLHVITVSNTDYDPISDTMHLPKGHYIPVEEKENVKITETENGVTVEFTLGSYESFALYTL